MFNVYNCFNEFMVLNNRHTTPPPSTVSTVRASRLGVRASKSYNYYKINNSPLIVDNGKVCKGKLGQIYEVNIESIYYFLDGSPSKGKFIPTFPLLFNTPVIHTCHKCFLRFCGSLSNSSNGCLWRQ